MYRDSDTAAGARYGLSDSVQETQELGPQICATAYKGPLLGERDINMIVFHLNVDKGLVNFGC